MPNYFQMVVKKINGDLHITPQGDFDAGSAWELSNLLYKKYKGKGRIIIDTGNLREICPFGRSTFECRLSQIRLPLERLIFQGQRASEIAPEGSRIDSPSEKEHTCSCNGKCTHCRCSGGKRPN